MHVWHYELETAMGSMWASFDGRGKLRQLAFGRLDPHATTPLAPKAQRVVVPFLLRQLNHYFARNLRTFTVPLDPQGTEFQKKVWNEVIKIPYGHTISHLELAQRIGDPKAEHAVAMAVAASPIAILIPCHRVMGPDDHLIGNAEGLERKQKLQKLEELEGAI